MRVEYLIIKEENNQCKTTAAFLSYLKTNDDLIVGNKEIVYNKFTLQYKLKTDKIISNQSSGRFFILELERKDSTGKKKLEELEKFAEMCKIIRGMIQNSNFEFNLIILFDSVSAYYSEKAYPLLNTIENLMRKLIFKFMFMKIGINWLKDATPKEVQEKISTKGSKNNVKSLVQESLYEADFIVLVDHLFKPYSTLSYDKLIEKVKDAKHLKDIQFKELKEIVPKSNWDRYFSQFVKIEKLNIKWTELYSLRNKIAHNKPISKGEFDRIKLLTDDLSEKLIAAIEKIDEIKIAEQEKNDIKESAIAEFFGEKKQLNYEMLSSYVYNSREREEIVDRIKNQRNIIAHSPNFFESNSDPAGLDYLKFYKSLNNQVPDSDPVGNIYSDFARTQSILKRDPED
jgi:hypothetical protein